MNPTHEAWTSAIRSVQEKTEGGSDLWLGQVDCVGITDGELLLKVPNAFTRDWISERYLPGILEQMSGVLPQDVQVRFQLGSGQEGLPPRRQAPSRPPQPRRAAESTRSSAVNPRFTFDSFVEGPSNQLALSACRALAACPERAISPLFICGPSGLGKTHLLNAIHNAMRGTSDLGVVRYASSEAFMNDFVESLGSGGIRGFRERYRKGCGVLLIDDIQFLVTREKTREEFFHVFNELYNTGRPIVITSDRPPREFANLEERLRTRFEWGLIADIRMPDGGTRLAIARKKAAQMGLGLSDDVLEFVADNATGSVREIEGVLIRLDVQSSIARTPPDLDMAREVFGLLATPRNRQPGVDDVMRAAANEWGVKVSDLKGARRHRTVTMPRQVAMWICRDMLELSFPEIGDRFGGRDHSTVMNACRKIARLVEDDAETRSRVERLTSELRRG